VLGFTLLEMLLVIFLMALVASTGLMLTEGVEEQSKYDETKRRMEMIRKAIVGDPTRTVNGSPEISGFVADMGRLPGCLAELIEITPDPDNPEKFLSPCDGATEIPVSSLDSNSGLRAGWRGPYISALSDHDGIRRFRDGYGNEDIDEDGAGIADDNDDALNFGWVWRMYEADGATATLNPDDAVMIRIKSKGFDGQEGNADDYPDLPVDDVKPIVDEYDYRVGFQNWSNVKFQVENASSAAITLAKDSLRLVLNYSDGAPPNAIGVVDSVPFPLANLVIPAAASSGSVAVANGSTLTVPAGTTLTDTTLSFSANGKITFPGGDVSVTTVDSVAVPASSTLPAGSTVLTIGSDGTVGLPAGSTVTLTTAFAGLPSSYGQFSLIVACTDAVNVTAVDGKRYDGDCTRYGTDASPIIYQPVNQPYLFSAPPRSTVVTPPSTLIWTVQ
jgi:hypothetical protein